ncbi:MAG: glycosyl hydrolase [Bacteroidota bacterium]
MIPFRFSSLAGFFLVFPFLVAPSPDLPDWAQVQMVDKAATAETKALYANLMRIAPSMTLFGQEDALAYGVEWKDWHKKRSDIKDVCGQHPALYGWELGMLGESEQNLDSVRFDHMQQWIKQVYRMGGVNTISWHMNNFVTGGNTWDVGEKVVREILPEGKHHQDFLQKLDHFAAFVDELQVGWLKKKVIPIIFRPFHEHTGGWFWWGKSHCTPEEYRALWQFTVHYLRDTKGLHNLIWCYSPDIVDSEEAYLEYYPGDEYVDILGLDDYHDFRAGQDPSKLQQRLEMLVGLAKAKQKVAALSETGLESIPQADWWTRSFSPNFLHDSPASNIAYVMVWRNARPDHHYGPYPGQGSASDFLEFIQQPSIILEDDLPNLYRIPSY